MLVGFLIILELSYCKSQLNLVRKHILIIYLVILTFTSKTFVPTTDWRLFAIYPFHVDQCFLAFQEVLCDVLHRISLCNEWNMSISYFALVCSDPNYYLIQNNIVLTLFLVQFCSKLYSLELEFIFLIYLFCSNWSFA